MQLVNLVTITFVMIVTLPLLTVLIVLKEDTQNQIANVMMELGMTIGMYANLVITNVKLVQMQVITVLLVPIVTELKIQSAYVPMDIMIQV